MIETIKGEGARISLAPLFVPKRREQKAFVFGIIEHMKHLLVIFLCAVGALVGMAAEPARDITVVRSYIEKAVGKKEIEEIRKREGGEKFLKKFFSDREWMEEFAGSGRPGTYFGQRDGTYAASLKALDLLVWNDKGGFTDTKIGRNIATAFALDHGHDWDERKLVLYMECYREWAKDGTLHDTAWKHDVWRWREVVCMGQNDMLSVENLRWIHDHATIPAARYADICWQSCHYRLFNCFGASVHGPLYYRPWEHRWNTQELRHRVGGVCGALSKFGSHCGASHGVRSYTAGQPGHCAFMIWNYDANRWGQAYAVTSHTNPHFSLGGSYWPALEEQNRYYSNPKRMQAEYLRWKGNYEAAMTLVPGNWNAAWDWMEKIKANPSPDRWEKFAKTLRETFATEPCQGWQLYMKYLEAFSANKAERVAAAKKGFLAFREHPAPTVEPMYFEERVLDPVFNVIGSDDATIWALLPAILEGQGASKNYYAQAINWAAGKLMKGPESAKRFLKIVAASSLKTKRELDYRGMIVKASQSEDIAMYRQVYSLLDKLSPKLAPKRAGKEYPKVDYGWPLVSEEGLLKVSSTSEWDSPVSYRNALEAAEFEGGNSFHTEKEEAPWAEVVLPGDSEVYGVTIVNSGGGQNGGRQVPIEVSVSKDGKSFTKVWESEQVQNEWKVTLPSPQTARYVRVSRRAGSKKEVYHLHKILVYGRKLY